MADHYHVYLGSFPASQGDVLTKDGEFIGTYTCDDNDFCEFTPDGENEVVVASVFVGEFCKLIAEWFDAKEEC